MVGVTAWVAVEVASGMGVAVRVVTHGVAVTVLVRAALLAGFDVSATAAEAAPMTARVRVTALMIDISLVFIRVTS